ncbi:oligomeric golgi complex component, COG2-domain-containing protein [Colletotrichum phormii]|uniref:Conserved oligomeric Golgi complex subunit 2 n=1 Tax=Colletotrichum phormii TaxID=359342 RepID=A0AAI9ZW25_9PEZI|nr:oligomeric golgi complex component, COG2-domain-containing protein [Colletotrichum phormii]KAK1637904.1 oligomeric golgi complex component, COG2-domain-containing protein [Colletotrichum phormii]
MANLGIQSPTRQQPALHLPSSSSSVASGTGSGYEDDDAPLPFPAALPRSDFLAPNFHPANYLSALPHRHQTLDDLKAELRDRSAAISAELLELVNGNYTAFLSLGNELRGGDERVENVRVAMLGFRRAVEEIKGKVRTRGEEVQGLSGELREVRRGIEVGRKMLELDERVSSLEERLALASLPGKRKTGDGGEEEEDDDDWDADDSEESDEEEDDDVGGLVGSSPAKLAGFAQDFCIVEALADAVGRDAQFVVKAEARMVRCRNTILLDLGTAMKEARKAGKKGQARTVKYLGLYGLLDAQAEAIRTLKSS